MELGFAFEGDGLFELARLEVDLVLRVALAEGVAEDFFLIFLTGVAASTSIVFLLEASDPVFERLVALLLALAFLIGALLADFFLGEAVGFESC